MRAGVRVGMTALCLHTVQHTHKPSDFHISRSFGDKKKVKAPLNSSPWDKAIDTLKAIASALLHWLGAGQLVGTHSSWPTGERSPCRSANG